MKSISRKLVYLIETYDYTSNPELSANKILKAICNSDEEVIIVVDKLHKVYNQEEIQNSPYSYKVIVEDFVNDMVEEKLYVVNESYLDDTPSNIISDTNYYFLTKQDAVDKQCILDEIYNNAPESCMSKEMQLNRVNTIEVHSYNYEL